MDPGTRIQLKARIRQEVETMLTEGDRVYLQGLSPSALLEAVESELRFLGLYAHEDQESSRTWIRHHLLCRRRALP